MGGFISALVRPSCMSAYGVYNLRCRTFRDFGSRTIFNKGRFADTTRSPFSLTLPDVHTIALRTQKTTPWREYTISWLLL